MSFVLPLDRTDVLRQFNEQVTLTEIEAAIEPVRQLAGRAEQSVIDSWS